MKIFTCSTAVRRTAMALVASVATSVAVAETLVRSENVPTLVLGQWYGDWTTDLRPIKGNVTLTIRSAQEGRITGSGTSVGGPCSEGFDLKGRYKGTEVKLRLKFATAECGEAGLAMRLGRDNNGDLILLGTWSERQKGRAEGMNFGLLRLIKRTE